MANDIVERLRVIYCAADDLTPCGTCLPCQAADEIVRLRAAGDALAHTLSVQSEWTCCADGWFGPCDCPPDAASRPTNGRVATALDTWKEARRG